MSEPLNRLRQCKADLASSGKIGTGEYEVHRILMRAIAAIEDELVRRELEAQKAGAVPDRETFWLVERNLTPPQYVSHNSAGWHSDPWQARRFRTEREAHDYWRLMGEIDRQQFKVVEHLFINKPSHQ